MLFTPKLWSEKNVGYLTAMCNTHLWQCIILWKLQHSCPSIHETLVSNIPWCGGKIPTLARMGWRYSVTHWCYTVTVTIYQSTLFRYSVTSQFSILCLYPALDVKCKAAYILANIVFTNVFRKFIFPRTSGKLRENDEPTVPAVTWKLLAR